MRLRVPWKAKCLLPGLATVDFANRLFCLELQCCQSNLRPPRWQCFSLEFNIMHPEFKMLFPARWPNLLTLKIQESCHRPVSHVRGLYGLRHLLCTLSKLKSAYIQFIIVCCETLTNSSGNIYIYALMYIYIYMPTSDVCAVVMWLIGRNF